LQTLRKYKEKSEPKPETTGTVPVVSWFTGSIYLKENKIGRDNWLQNVGSLYFGNKFFQNLKGFINIM
ncbi:MAG: hypothetical protein PHE70_08085, partial [Tepidanaerobacteraceae bacterium]|nr:hypothetical protein [Tepidanaerobacteraceae bacterium]